MCFLVEKQKLFFIKCNVKDSRLWQVTALFFSVFDYTLAVVSRTCCWVNALVVLVVWILIMVYFSDISKTLSASPCLLVIWRLIMINLLILKRVRVKWCCLIILKCCIFSTWFKAREWASVESTAPSKPLLILSVAGDPDNIWLHKSKNVATTRPPPLCLQ